jgi:replicative DNA helicase
MKGSQSNMVSLKWQTSDEQAVERECFKVHREQTLKNKKCRIPNGVAEIMLAKHHNGPTGKIKVAFLKEYTRFESLSYVVV